MWAWPWDLEPAPLLEICLHTPHTFCFEKKVHEGLLLVPQCYLLSHTEILPITKVQSIWVHPIHEGHPDSTAANPHLTPSAGAPKTERKNMVQKIRR